MKIPISGMGCVCALGADLGEIKKNLFAAAAEPVLPKDRLQSPYADSFPAFMASQKILKEKQKDESYGFLFLRKAADEALKTAGINPQDLQDARVGVIAGTTVNASFNCFDFYKAWRAGKTADHGPLLDYLNTPLSAALQKHYNLKGPQMTITTACASGTDAIGIAAQWIAQDMCDIVLAGAADELNLIPYTGFIRLMIASPKPCEPFAKDRGGINLGEGAGLFVMESPQFMKKRGAKAIGYMLGYGTCCDAYHPTAPDPSGAALKKAIENALSEAGLKAQDLAFINAHGTGTQDNDAAEAKVFNALLPGVPVMASKSHTGHTLGAAGAVEAALTLLCLNEGLIAKTARWGAADMALNLIPVLENTPVAAGKKAALSDSLAFGGCNSVIALAGGGIQV
ncbi:MAG: beta-ketoacyl-[acyl-carrier-protein] synthase family protein [Elusimicrobiota bacterium]|jgi:3-oxoacyl-[acyl-carrier-protein] synthase-1/3-oxoacyl-[acyl-carrier-protein] synthase II|nr:beta-ketoacyl-[acyl-carrier-protein] synthase family protein [Elusimicrobiota bacterium]